MKYACYLVLALALLLTGCAGESAYYSNTRTHEHLTPVGNQYYPDPGYKWDRADANGRPVPGDLAVHWAPGSSYWNAAVNTYPHIVAGEEPNTWFPAAGYTWTNPGDQTNMSVFWKPGHAYEEVGVISKPHLLASDTEGSWWPAPGYTWDRVDASGNPYAGDMAVHWDPGRHYSRMGQSTFPHIVASEAEGKWYPEPGYDWLHLDSAGHPILGDLAVHWVPGRSYSSQGRIVHPHVSASKTEGSWYPDPGYTWSEVDATGNPLPSSWEVKWLPGISYLELGETKYPHVVASDTQGDWVPAKGYAWANDVDGDFTVVAAATPAPSAARTSANGTSPTTPSDSSSSDAAATRGGNGSSHGGN